MIPLIIPNFNQLTYLRNLINWWMWYYPENKIYIIDNASTYKPLTDYYNEVLHTLPNVNVMFYENNDCQQNLTQFLKSHKFEYYVISDPDIMPHPSTPPNFLEVFKAAIDQGYHRAGFDLITSDLPDWLYNRDTVIENEKLAGDSPAGININGVTYHGRQAAIDTTFCMYTSKNSGWHQPFNGTDWPNAFRVFYAFHLPWYQHPDHLNEETRNYFETCKKHDGTTAPAGRNNYRPAEYL